MKLTDFDDTRRIKRGEAIKVRLHGQQPIKLGRFMGVLPGKPNAGSFRERQDAIIVRNGDLINYFRRNDVCDIEVDGRHLTKETA